MKRVKAVNMINKVVPASFWKRFFAYIIDILLVNIIVSLPFSSHFSKFGDNISLIFGSTDPSLFWISLLVVFLVLFYFVFMEYRFGQTVGKMLFNIYAISIVGKKMGFNQSLIRNILKPFPIALLVDVAYMFFKRERRRLFEFFSGTTVVEMEMMFK